MDLNNDKFKYSVKIISKNEKVYYLFNDGGLVISMIYNTKNRYDKYIVNIHVNQLMSRYNMTFNIGFSNVYDIIKDGVFNTNTCQFRHMLSNNVISTYNLVVNKIVYPILWLFIVDEMKKAGLLHVDTIDLIIGEYYGCYGHQ